MSTQNASPGPLDDYLTTIARQDLEAESSIRITGDWKKRLAGMADGVEVKTSGDVITRSDLFELAEVDRREHSARSVLDLFWNIMAWGTAGSFRNVPRLVEGVVADQSAAATALRQAQDLSWTGKIKESHFSLKGAIKFSGEAFFTKFLYFTADRDQPVYPLILDDRVRTAWGILTGRWPRRGSSDAYTQFCVEAGEAAKRHSLGPEQIEASLYHLGRRTGSHERWLKTSLQLCHERLGDSAPAVSDVLAQLKTRR